MLSSYFGFNWKELQLLSGLDSLGCLNVVLSHHRRNFAADALCTILYLAVDDIQLLHTERKEFSQQHWLCIAQSQSPEEQLFLRCPDHWDQSQTF